MKMLVEKKYAELAQEEIESVKEALGRTSAEKLARQVDNAKTRDVNENPNRVIARSSNNPDYINSMIAYHEMAKENIRKSWDHELGKPVEIDIEDEDDEDDEIDTDAAGYSERDHEETYVERDLTGVDRTKPYIISDQEFCEEFPHHDKVSLYYYLDDGTLCGEDEEILPDVVNTVGLEVLDIVRAERLAWVRNEPLGIDFEICYVRNSYLEAVLGVRPDNDIPREGYKKEVPGQPLSPREAYTRKNNKRWSEEDEE